MVANNQPPFIHQNSTQLFSLVMEVHLYGSTCIYLGRLHRDAVFNPNPDLLCIARTSYSPTEDYTVSNSVGKSPSPSYVLVLL